MAKCTDLCAVRVLGNDGSGTWSGVIEGIDHVMADCAAVDGRKCVANMSLGGGRNSLIDTAISCDHHRTSLRQHETANSETD